MKTKVRSNVPWNENMNSSHPANVSELLNSIMLINMMRTEGAQPGEYGWPNLGLYWIHLKNIMNTM